MTIDTWLKIGAIGLPIIGAITIWRLGDRSLRAQRGLAVSIFCIVGLFALSLFVLNRHYACIYVFGRQNCLFDGLATLSLFLLNLVLVIFIVLRGKNKGYDYILLLLLSGAWAGLGLGNSLLLFLISLYLFFFALRRYMKNQGFRGGYLKLRDDYENDRK